MENSTNGYERVKYHVDGIWLIINAILDGLWGALDRGHVNRRIAFWLMWYITFEAYHFCYEAGKASGWDPAAIAAAFGILTPVSLLQGAVFKLYSDGKKCARQNTE